MKIAIVLAAFALAGCGPANHGAQPGDPLRQARAPKAITKPSPGLEPASYQQAEPPITLTGPDGIALKLERLHVEAMVEGPLAYTELSLAFRNPEQRRIEGRFQIALPPRASLARFAMKIGGRWQEA